jgi:hypothetical protein
MNGNIQKLGHEHVCTITLQLVVVAVDSCNFGLDIILVMLQNHMQLPITLRPLCTCCPSQALPACYPCI